MEINVHGEVWGDAYEEERGEENERFVAEFGGVWVEEAGCGGPEWVDGEGSEAGFEGYSMEEGEIGLER